MRPFSCIVDNATILNFETKILKLLFQKPPSACKPERLTWCRQLGLTISGVGCSLTDCAAVQAGPASPVLGTPSHPAPSTASQTGPLPQQIKQQPAILARDLLSLPPASQPSARTYCQPANCEETILTEPPGWRL